MPIISNTIEKLFRFSFLFLLGAQLKSERAKKRVQKFGIEIIIIFSPSLVNKWTTTLAAKKREAEEKSTVSSQKVVCCWGLGQIEVNEKTHRKMCALKTSFRSFIIKFRTKIPLACSIRNHYTCLLANFFGVAAVSIHLREYKTIQIVLFFFCHRSPSFPLTKHTNMRADKTWKCHRNAWAERGLAFGGGERKINK